MLVALLGNAVILILSTVPPDISIPPNVDAGTVALVVPPGLFKIGAVVVFAVGGCSIPKFTSVTFAKATVTGTIEFGVPSLPAAVPTFSPVATQPAGKFGAGAVAPTVPAVVFSCTVNFLFLHLQMNKCQLHLQALLLLLYQKYLPN